MKRIKSGIIGAGIFLSAAAGVYYAAQHNKTAAVVAVTIMALCAIVAILRVKE